MKDLPLVNGIAVKIPKSSLKRLSEEVLISRIENDNIIQPTGKKSSTPTVPQQTLQTVPWGISKIQGDMTYSLTTANTVKVGILDSGIELSHPDLINNIKGSFNTLKRNGSANDEYGHGTHVAGIIAASNNSIGVVGVAPQVDLFPIKILDNQGVGFSSDLIEGIDWAIKNGIQVLNMSFSVADSQTLHDAIIKANQAGIVQVASSGNSSSNSVEYPATYPEVISVSAIDENNQLSWFSSTGKVDICAPGSEVYSTYPGSYYATLSGTSMAAAHVTGVVALLFSLPLKSDLNGDGICTPDEIRQRLENTAIDLGSDGKDNIYGAGLVNAYDAVTK